MVIDSDDLVVRPDATMAAHCAAVELPFIPEALTWEPGERPEWRRSAHWHTDVSASSGFAPHGRSYTHTVESSDELARCAAHHRPLYEQLHAQRLDVAAWGANGGLLTGGVAGVPLEGSRRAEARTPSLRVTGRPIRRSRGRAASRGFLRCTPRALTTGHGIDTAVLATTGLARGRVSLRWRRHRSSERQPAVVFG